MIRMQAWKHLNKSPLSAYDYERFGCAVRSNDAKAMAKKR